MAFAFSVGDRVMAYHYGWYEGTVVEIGSGQNSGLIQVRRDKYPTIPEWYKPNDLKPAAEQNRLDTEAAKALADGPRLGRYRAWGNSGNGSVPILYGDILLESGGSYKHWRAGNEYAGEGRWRYDSASKSVIWLSGPLKGLWQGGFSVRGEGKVHAIRLDRLIEATNGL